VVPEADYKQFIHEFKKPNLDRDFYRWQYYGQQALTIKRNMRPIFKVLDFSCTNDGLTEAIAFLRRHLSSGLSFRDYAYEDIPMNFGCN
jgi:hypothetical protein